MPLARCPRCATPVSVAPGAPLACRSCGYRAPAAPARTLPPSAAGGSGTRPASAARPPASPAARPRPPPPAIVRGPAGSGPIGPAGGWVPAGTPPPRRRRTGVVVAVVAVAVLLLAGGVTGAVLLLKPGGDDLEDQAEAAARRLSEDSGKDGGLRGMRAVARMEMDAGGDRVEIGMELELIAYASDAITVEFKITDMEVDGQPFTQLDGARITIACRPDRIVLRSTGFDRFGGNADVETVNDGGGCYEADTSTSMSRLGRASPGMVGQIAASFEDPTSSRDRRTVESAERRGTDLVAVYDVRTKEGIAKVTSVIRDGRIVSDEGDLTQPEGKMHMRITYSYGERDDPPAVKGARVV